MTTEGPMTQIANDDPRMIAWKAYQETDAYKNSKHWAMTIFPMMYAKDPPEKLYSLMAPEQREKHVEGSLWAAFLEGWERRP